jgi:hypothetical protein
MRVRVCGVVLSVAAVVAAAACTKSSPVTPSPAAAPAAATADAKLTASIAAPRPVTPANNATVPNASQPVTLIVQNAIVTKPGGTTYTFEVATDSAFTSTVQTKDGVAEGASGQTGVKLDTLAAAKDYYWHARATGGGTTGLFGTVYKFTVGPAITVNAPVPIGPLTGTTTIARPALRVTNATRIGATGPITYFFEISTTPAFASTIASGTNTEGVNETGFIPTADLPSSGLLYWRATAIDAADGITSAPSAVQSFTANVPSQAAVVAAKLGVTLWPGVQPPGTTGHATMGTDWNVEPITSFDGFTFINPPLDELQIFDLLDRGMSPPDAVTWMHANGYATIGVWYPDVQVLAFAYEYVALINGQWDIVLRVGA